MWVHTTPGDYAELVVMIFRRMALMVPTSPSALFCAVFYPPGTVVQLSPSKVALTGGDMHEL